MTEELNKENINEGKCDKKSCKKKTSQELEKLKEENALLNDKLLRIAAEMQNMKRRYDEEISKLYKYDGMDFAKKILPVIDNFERAIKLDDNNLDDEKSKFLEGFKMIYGSMVSILKEKGIVEIECLGKEFDPNLMDAILTDKDDTFQSNVVLDVMQKGYIYNDKVIRPAMVKVNE